MTRTEAWTHFAASALATVMPGSRPEEAEQRSRLAARWADTMTEEWARRHALPPVVEDPKPRKGK